MIEHLANSDDQNFYGTILNLNRERMVSNPMIRRNVVSKLLLVPREWYFGGIARIFMREKDIAQKGLDGYF